MLEGVGRGTKRPPRMVIYGPPKIGKSTLGSESPAPIFVTTEDGVDNLPVDQFPRAESWEQFLGRVKQVVDDDHKYETLVVDTLNGAIDLAAAHVCKTQFKGNWGKGGFSSFAEGWSATSEECRRLLPMLDACRARGMMVLLLAHAGILNIKNPTSGDYTKWTPSLDKRVWARFSAWSDVILRAEYEHTVSNPDGKGNKAVSTDSRILKACGSIAEDAGCRVGYELPDELPLSWPALAEALGRDSHTLAEVEGRWGLLDKAEQTKAVAWLGVASKKNLVDAPVAKLRQLLNRLKIKEAENAA